MFIELEKMTHYYLVVQLLSTFLKKLILSEAFLFPFQELEFSNLFAVLHCIHSFFAAKVACLDPLFLGNQATASAASSSATTSKAKYTTWHTELCIVTYHDYIKRINIVIILDLGETMTSPSQQWIQFEISAENKVIKESQKALLFWNTSVNNLKWT